MPPGLRLRSHTHGSSQLVFVLEGSYRERWAGRDLRLRPGSVIFRPADAPHANVFDGGEVLALLVSYRRDRLPGSARSPGPIEVPPLLADLRAQVEVELRRDDPESALALEGLALLLAARVTRFARAGRPPAWLADALHFIDTRHTDSIGLSAVAAAVGRSRTTVAAAFRRFVGRSAGDTIRGTQVRSAVARLRGSNLPLAEVAVECGFYDQAHMGRWVKRATGLTPGEIRAGAPVRCLPPRSPRLP